jgi:F-type H+-transporting ATPase subunit delta
MAESVTIARPYAEAAFKLAREKNQLEAWSQMLRLLDLVVQDAAVAGSISDPNVSSEKLLGLILGVCGEQLDGAGRNFVQVLEHNNRLTLLPEIRAMFEALRLEHEGVLEAEIQSAFAIDDAQVAQLVKKLEGKYQRKVRARVSVDAKLIGGIKIVVGDKVVDATVRGKLDAMSAALIR